MTQRTQTNPFGWRSRNFHNVALAALVRCGFLDFKPLQHCDASRKANPDRPPPDPPVRLK